MWSVTVPGISWSLPWGMIFTVDRYVRPVRRLGDLRRGDRRNERRGDRRGERRDRVRDGDRRRGI